MPNVRSPEMVAEIARQGEHVALAEAGILDWLDTVNSTDQADRMTSSWCLKKPDSRNQDAAPDQTAVTEVVDGLQGVVEGVLLGV